MAEQQLLGKLALERRETKMIVSVSASDSFIVNDSIQAIVDRAIDDQTSAVVDRDLHVVVLGDRVRDRVASVRILARRQRGQGGPVPPKREYQ